MAVYSTYSKSRIQLKREIQKDELIIKKAGKVEDLPGSVRGMPQQRTCDTDVSMPNSIESVECLDDQHAGQTGKISGGIGRGNVEMPPVDPRDPVVNTNLTWVQNTYNRKISDTNQAMAIYFGHGDNMNFEHAEERMPSSVTMAGSLDPSRAEGSVGPDAKRKERALKEEKELARRRRR